jgi:hypothetical protein
MGVEKQVLYILKPVKVIYVILRDCCFSLNICLQMSIQSERSNEPFMLEFQLCYVHISCVLVSIVWFYPHFDASTGGDHQVLN